MLYNIDLKIVSFFLILSLFLCGYSCEKSTESSEEEKYDYLTPPEGFPPIPFPENNPYSYEKVQLGRKLFYEKLLSKNRDLPSCSHCMKQRNAFCDDTPISRAHNDEAEYRNTMSLNNVAYRKNLFWDGRGKRIEGPAYRSLWLPMILGADTSEIINRLVKHPEYPEMFRQAFGEDAKPNATLVSKAIATFVRTLVSGNSRYDRYVRGEKNLLTEAELRGMELFFNQKRTNCSNCHSDFMFTDGKYHNTGVHTHYFDRGRFYVSGKNEDRGKFITPTLRNIAETAPYMHNGDMASLEVVLEHYNRGGRPFINKDSLMRPLNLRKHEIADLIAFLKTLTDEEFINNPKYMNPN